MHAQLALRGEVIELADVPEVAFMVAVQLRREFRIECRAAPDPYLSHESTTARE